MIFCISPGALREPLPGRPHGSAASGRKALPQSAARRCKTPPPAVVNPPTRVSKPPSIPQNEAAVKGHSERHAGLQISVLVQNIASHADGTPPPPALAKPAGCGLGMLGTTGITGNCSERNPGPGWACHRTPKNSDAGARHQHKPRSASIQHPAIPKIKTRISPTRSQGRSPGLHLKRGRGEETGFAQ